MLTSFRGRVKELRVALLRGTTDLTKEGVHSRFAVGIAWGVLGSVGARAFVLLGALVAARLLGADGYGKLGIIQSTVALFGTLAGFGLGLTATKYAAAHHLTDPDRSGRYIAVVLVTAVIAGIVMTAALVALAEPVSRGLLASPDLDSALRVSAGLVFFGAIAGSLSGALLGIEDYRRHAMIMALRGVTGATFSVGGIVVGGVTGGIAGMVIGEAVTAIGAVFALRRGCAARGVRIRFSALGEPWRILWRFSLPALLASLVIMPALFATNILLARSAGGYAELGIFAIALKWNTMVLFLPAALSMPQLPLLSSLYGSGERELFRRALRLYLVLCVGIIVPAATLIAFAAPLIMHLHGSAFARGGAVLVAMAAAALPMGLNNIIGQAVISADGIVWRMSADVMLAASLLLAGWWLIPSYGALGLALAYSLAYTTATVWLLAFGWMRKISAQPIRTHTKLIAET